MASKPRKATQQEMRSEIASIDRSITDLLFFGGGQKILINGDSVLRARGRGKGLAIYDDLERDAHAGSVLDKRKSAVTGREWEVTPASDDSIDKQAAEAFTDVLNALKFDQMCKELLDANLKGYSVVELMWGLVDGQFVPTTFIARDQNRFVFGIDRRPRLLTREQMIEGEELPDRKFIVHTVGGKDGSPYGRGLGHRIFWPVFFKRQNISFWLIFNDKYGSPTAKGTYPAGTNESQQKRLLQTLRSISNDAGIIIPEGMVVELLQAAKAGMDGYERLCHYMDGEISKAVLGETQTTTVGNSGGNRALGEVHNEVRLELAKDDADLLSYTLNDSLARWFTELNYPGRQPPNVWRNFDEPDDLDKIAARDTKLKELGWERDEESFIKTYGAGYRKIVTPPPADPSQRQPPPTQLQEFSEAAPKGLIARVRDAVLRTLHFAETDPVETQRERNRVDQDTIDEGAVRLAEQWEEIVGPRVKELQELIDETGDLTVFRDRLSELLQSPPSAEFVEQVARSTFAARLAARLPRQTKGEIK